MAIELLGHHEDIVKRLANKQGNVSTIVRTYIIENVNLGSKYMKPMGPIIKNLVTFAREGGEFLRLPENTNRGDRICGSCRRFGDECRLGHVEYEFSFPDGKLATLPQTKWKQFSVDVQSNNLINTYKHFNELRKLIGKNGLGKKGGLTDKDCEKEFLPSGVGMMEFLVFPDAVKTEQVSAYVIELGKALVDFGGAGTNVLIRVSDSPNGTSMRPENWLLSLNTLRFVIHD